MGNSRARAMQNYCATESRGRGWGVSVLICCLAVLALAGWLGGCQSLNSTARVKEPLGQPPSAEGSHAQAYFHYLKAQRYLLAEDILAAIREYKEAAKQDPASPQLQIELAILYQRHGEFTKALVHVGKALKIDPKNEEAHFLLAGLHVGLNQLQEAIAGYEPVAFSQEPIEEAAEPQESAPESIEHPESTEPGE